ncbi:MAG: ATP-binding protein [Acidobacteriota bacterium]|nr:ATP-binding protein [Acidobacteriota bacterium]
MLASMERRDALRVLLVEDDEQDMVIVRHCLKAVKTPYVLDWVDTYEQGCAALESDDYDACLTDFRLGKNNGLELVKQAAQHEWRSPVILMTGMNSRDIEVQSIKSGADDFLMKDEISGPLLDRTIRLSIERHRDKMALRESEERYRMLAEISSAALHNIGNVLNSVGTACYTLKSSLVTANRSNKLNRLARLIRENAEEPAFLIRDQRGQLLPTYLEQLSQTNTLQRNIHLGEVQQMERALELATTVVRGQQTVFKNPGRDQNFCLFDAVQAALDVRAASLANDHIRVRKNDCGVYVVADRIMVTHILINLIKNAIEAMKLVDAARRTLTLTSRVISEARAEISVQDTGVGISEENFKKLFTRGFTTKTHGNGVGLHFCRQAAEFLGGELIAESEGEGKGACFRLIFPKDLVVQ